MQFRCDQERKLRFSSPNQYNCNVQYSGRKLGLVLHDDSLNSILRQLKISNGKGERVVTWRNPSPAGSNTGRVRKRPVAHAAKHRDITAATCANQWQTCTMVSNLKRRRNAFPGRRCSSRRRVQRSTCTLIREELHVHKRHKPHADGSDAAIPDGRGLGDGHHNPYLGKPWPAELRRVYRKRTSAASGRPGRHSIGTIRL